MFVRAAIIAASSVAAVAATADTCANWAEPVIAGQLDVALLPEASGIAVSRAAERLYHINDGARTSFFVTDLDGAAAQRVTVSGFAPVDLEDLALGRCGDATCLYLADVGDNALRRPFVQIAVVEEAARFGAEVAPKRVITARYPDGPHNAEAVAIHPSGALLLVTKAGTGAGQEGPALVYRMSAAQLEVGGEQTFEARGTIPFTALTDLGRRRVVTAMDIAPDGRRAVLLSYDAAVELAFDLDDALPGPDRWVAAQTHRAFRIAPLIQAEAIAYDRDGRSIVYGSESVRGSAAPLIRQTCTG